MNILKKYLNIKSIMQSHDRASLIYPISNKPFSENNTHGSANKTTVYSEAEGFTVDSSAHKIVIHEVLAPLTSAQKLEIVSNIENKNYICTNISYDNKNKLVENSEERHMNMVTTYTKQDDTKGLIIFGSVTSTNDNSTIILTNKQYLNDDPREKSKKQRVRIFTNPIETTQETLDHRYIKYTSEEKVALEKKEEEFKNFLTEETGKYEGVNIHAKIIKKYKDNLDNASVVLKPVLFNQEKLKDLAEKAYNNDCDKLQEEYDTKVDASTHADEITRRRDIARDIALSNKAEKEAQFNQNKSLLNQEHKKLIETKQILEEQEKKYKKKKASEKKHIENMESKERHKKPANNDV